MWAVNYPSQFQPSGQFTEKKKSIEAGSGFAAPAVFLCKSERTPQHFENAAAADFAAAISGLRELSTPYHLAHGLLDYAGYLTRRGEVEAAALAIDEARGIGQQLRCEPLLSRAADMASPQSHIPVLRAVASNAVAPGAADDR